MDWWQAVILGAVEGLTEYLPISSTGHILVTQRLLGIAKTNASDAFAISVQLGAILAVVGLYFRRIQILALGASGYHPEGRRLLLGLIAAFLPAVAAGVILEKPIKKHLFGGEFGLWPIVFAWLVGGVAILTACWCRKKETREGVPLEMLTWKMALVIGLIQCLAMWPGVSRSLVTIVGGVLVGLSLKAAVEFSFLLGVLTLSAATAYDTLRHGSEMLHSYGWLPLTLGFLSSLTSALAAVRWMVAYLNKHGMEIFGYYRILIALIVAYLLLSGRL